MALYAHFSECPETSPGRWRWDNFTPAELSCPCCGEYFHDVFVLDALQRLREYMGKALIVNSAHRCPIHNARVGGAPLSHHKLAIAIDIRIAGHDRHELYKMAEKSGFSSFGFYRTFLHMDTRPGRAWFAKGAKKLWNG